MGGGFDLNGRWADVYALGSPEITISHELNTDRVRAEYGEARCCRDMEGATLEETTFDFKGILKGDKLKGQIHVCNFGPRVPARGWILERLELAVNAEGDRLDGRYFCRVDRNWMPIAITRIPKKEAS